MDVLLLQLKRWRNDTGHGDKNGALLLLLGIVLVAGVHVDEYGSLLYTLILLGTALGLQMTFDETIDDNTSPQTLLSIAMAMIIAAAVGYLTPESVAHAQQIVNDRAKADRDVMTMTTWFSYLVAAAVGQFAAGYFTKKQRCLSSANQAEARLVCISTGIMLFILVALWEQQWLRAALSATACTMILYVLVSRWWYASASFRNGTDCEVYLDTCWPSSGSDLKSDKLSELSVILGVLWSRPASRQMLLFLSINVAFMFVELGVGLYTNSLGLMGDAGHMLFDNGALTIGLVASYIGQLPPDAKFTYGYGRVEVLSGFLNSLLLLVVSFHLLTEAASRFMDPPKVTTDHLLLTSTAGLIVNLVGLFFFHDHVHGHSHSHGGDSGHVGGCDSGHGHSHGNSLHQAHGEDASEGGHVGGNSNMYGVYLHVLADTLGSVGVIISSLLIQLFEWHIADSASSALISLLILGSTMPLLRDTARQLLQGAPPELEDNINAALHDVQTIVPGVERIAQWNIWHHAADISVATLHLEVASSADEQRVLQYARDIFWRHARLDKFLSVQISKPQVLDMLGMEDVGAELPAITNGCSAVHGHGHSHGHDYSHGHSHSHGAKPSMTSSAFILHHQYPQHMATKMGTYENPASDDSRFMHSLEFRQRIKPFTATTMTSGQQDNR
ncbi:unnamed protein product [Peronospora belbahrii]|uniref:Cation efflux protein transmembrane domain-containing protein n=1 Tax=Peronospora belbahrii TaxID=622444 RepID=A0AAU9KV29_9STRA|nr:unnamed protein product [Peronospora belbahrii]CAH0519921.1 unnamed protein product [Peronospora belbahrii]